MMMYIAICSAKENHFWMIETEDINEARERIYDSMAHLTDSEKKTHTYHIEGWDYDANNSSWSEFVEAGLEGDADYYEDVPYEKHLSGSEISELAHDLDWGDPTEDPEDIKDSLRTNWAIPLDEESVEAVYEKMVEIWNDKNAD